MTTPLIQELVNEITENIIYGEGFDKLIGGYRVEDIGIMRKNMKKMELKVLELEGIKVEQSLIDENNIKNIEELRGIYYILVYRKSDNLLGLANINDIDYERNILSLKFSYKGELNRRMKCSKFEMCESACMSMGCCLKRYKFNEEGVITDEEISMYKTDLKFE